MKQATEALKTTYSVKLQEGRLLVTDDMYPARIDAHQPIVEGVASAFAASSSPTGGLFLQTTFDAPNHEHLLSLGTLRCHRLLAAARVTRYWMGPAFGERAHHVPHDTQFLRLELEPDGPYCVMLPLLDRGLRATLKGAEPPWRTGLPPGRGDELLLHAESGDKQVAADGMRALYVAAGADPYALLRRAFSEVADETGTFQTLDKKVLPPSVDSFGWCTWDAFYSKVEPRGVINGVQALRAAGVPPRTVILDDGWQQVEPSAPPESPVPPPIVVEPATQGGLAAALTAVGTWVSSFLLRTIATIFEGYYERFVRRAPAGALAARVWRKLANGVLKANLLNYFDTQTDFARQLSGFTPNAKFEAGGGEDAKSMPLHALVAKCKADLGVQYIYCWHALAGYWRGASASLGAHANLAIVQAEPQPSRHLLALEPQIAWDAVTVFGAGILTTDAQLAKFYSQLHAPLAAAGTHAASPTLDAPDRGYAHSSCARTLVWYRC